MHRSGPAIKQGKFPNFHVTVVHAIVGHVTGSTCNSYVMVVERSKPQERGIGHEDIEKGIISRLWGINYTNSCISSPEPRDRVFCIGLNFNISNTGSGESCFAWNFRKKRSPCFQFVRRIKISTSPRLIRGKY